MQYNFILQTFGLEPQDFVHMHTLECYARGKRHCRCQNTTSEKHAYVAHHFMPPGPKMALPNSGKKNRSAVFCGVGCTGTGFFGVLKFVIFTGFANTVPDSSEELVSLSDRGRFLAEQEPEPNSVLAAVELEGTSSLTDVELDGSSSLTAVESTAAGSKTS